MVGESSEGVDKSGLLLILRSNENLAIVGIAIEKSIVFMTS